MSTPACALVIMKLQICLFLFERLVGFDVMGHVNFRVPYATFCHSISMTNNIVDVAHRCPLFDHISIELAKCSIPLLNTYGETHYTHDNIKSIQISQAIVLSKQMLFLLLISSNFILTFNIFVNGYKHFQKTKKTLFTSISISFSSQI